MTTVTPAQHASTGRSPGAQRLAERLGRPAPASRGRRLLFAAGLGTLIAIAVLLCAWKVLRLAGYPLWVPFSYHEGDVLVMLMYIKSVFQDGWPLTLSQVSAPFGYPGPAFPHQTSFDWLLVKCMTVFTHEPGTLINSFWLLTLVMSAWSAAYAGYQLRLSAALACVTGVLYAFLPFAFMRMTHHLNLVYYMVPLMCLLAVLIAGGPRLLRNPLEARTVCLVACVLQGFDYIYFSFFAAALFGVAGLMAFRRSRWRGLRLPLLAIGLVTLATALNLSPALYSWHKDGKPTEMGYKAPAEAEEYGAKLRRMVVPHQDNPVRPLAKYGQKDRDAHFPLENENVTARLGLFGAFGLVLMLLMRLRLRHIGPRKEAAALDSISALGLATFLIITIGGFGAIFNLLIAPDIRAYNRFSVYLAFFAIVTAALWLEQRIALARRWPRRASYAAIGLFALLSLYDQTLDAANHRNTRDANIARARVERSIVEHLEQAIPGQALVLQLPFTGFPPMSTLENFISYDHARYSLWSTRLHWSWPSFSQQHRAWQGKLSALQGPALLQAAMLSGFEVIWIDRSAYKDRGEALMASLQGDGVRRVDLGSDNIIALDVRAAAAALRQRLGAAAFAAQAEALLRGFAIVEWKRGFYDEEKGPDQQPFHWAGQNAEIRLRNVTQRAMDLCVTFDSAVPNGGTLRIDGTDTALQLPNGTAPQAVSFVLRMPAGTMRPLRLSTAAPPLLPPGDPRRLYFYIKSFDAHALTPGQACAPARQG